LAYEKDWKGWGDWLGTGTLEPSARIYRPFLKARKTGKIIAIQVKNLQTYQAILIAYMRRSGHGGRTGLATRKRIGL